MELQDIYEYLDQRKLKPIEVLNIDNDFLFNSLNGIEKCKNLQVFKCRTSVIKDISPISSCKKIRYIDFTNNEIESIEPLKYCTGLRSLNIFNNEITSLKGLEGCKSLEMICGDYNPIKDIKSLQNGLKSLYMDNTLIDNITVLSGIKTLINLSLYNSFLTDIEPLLELYNIEKLDLNYDICDDYTFYKILDNNYIKYIGSEIADKVKSKIKLKIILKNTES